MTRRTVRILTMLLATALAAQVAAHDEEDGPEPGDAEEPGTTRTAEPCDLDGKGGGEVVRVAGSENGANMSSGFEDVSFELGGRSLFGYLHEGRLGPGGGNPVDPWNVRCDQGTVEIGGAVRLSVRDGSAAVEPAWLRALAPGALDPGTYELQRIREILAALSDVDVGEAKLRASLLLAERAVASGDTDVAAGALPQVEPGASPLLADWAKKLEARLARLRDAAPIRAAKPRRLGTLGAVPSRPDDLSTDGESGNEPELFWRSSAVCVRQEGAERAKMRCHDAARGTWGPLEPYASPFAGGVTIFAAYMGHSGLYATRVTVLDRGGKDVVSEDFHAPELLARDAKGGLVVLGKGMLAGDPRQVDTLGGYDAAASAGSRLAGGGAYWFEDARTLRGVKNPGRSWNVPTPSADAAPRCEGAPLTSPDEKRAVCLVAKPPGHELWLFELAPP